MFASVFTKFIYSGVIIVHDFRHVNRQYYEKREQEMQKSLGDFTMSFYDKFLDLCNRRGVTPSRAAQEAGISRSLPSKWKKYPNTAPSTDIMKQISRYFGVSVNELLFDKVQTPVEADEELLELLDMLRMRPECRILLSTAKGATREQVEANIRVIEAMRGYGHDD